MGIRKLSVSFKYKTGPIVKVAIQNYYVSILKDIPDFWMTEWIPALFLINK